MFVDKKALPIIRCTAPGTNIGMMYELGTPDPFYFISSCYVEDHLVYISRKFHQNPETIRGLWRSISHGYTTTQ